MFISCHQIFEKFGEKECFIDLIFFCNPRVPLVTKMIHITKCIALH